MVVSRKSRTYLQLVVHLRRCTKLTLLLLLGRLLLLLLRVKLTRGSLCRLDLLLDRLPPLLLLLGGGLRLASRGVLECLLLRKF